MKINYNEPTASLRRIPVYLMTPANVPVTGAVPVGAQIQVSASGAAWVNGAGVWFEDGAGLYYYQATQSETATNSFLLLRVAFPGAKIVVFSVDIGERVIHNEIDPTKTRIPIYLEDAGGNPVPGQSILGAEQQLTKNGAVLVNAAGTTTEIGGVGLGLGAYYYTPTALEIDTLGYGGIVIDKTPAALPYVYVWNVVPVPFVPPVPSTITIAIVSPPEGSVIGRATPLVFTVTGTNSFRRVWVSATLGGSNVEETVHTGITFAPIYLGGVNSRSNVTIGPESGYLFNVLRLGGWRGSSVTLRIIAIDTAGFIGYKTLAVPEALYSWQIAGGGFGDVTPFIGQEGL